MKFKILFLSIFLSYVSVSYAQDTIVRKNNLKSHNTYLWHIENATDYVLDDIDVSVFNYDSGHSEHISSLNINSISDDFSGDGYTTDPDHQSVLISYKGEYYSIEDVQCNTSSGSSDVPVNFKVLGDAYSGFILNISDDRGHNCSKTFTHFGRVNNNI